MKVYVQNNSGSWDDICGCKYRKADNTWSAAIKDGDKIRNTINAWVTVDCETIFPCGSIASYTGGEAFPTTLVYDLGTSTGVVSITFSPLSIPDKMIATWDSNEVVNTGYIGDTSYQAALDAELASRSLPPETITPDPGTPYTFNKLSSVRYLTIDVYAPLPGTSWSVQPGCPV